VAGGTRGVDSDMCPLLPLGCSFSWLFERRIAKSGAERKRTKLRAAFEVADHEVSELFADYRNTFRDGMP
jgi:hypothetical protein